MNDFYLRYLKNFGKENIHWDLIVILFPYLKGIGFFCPLGNHSKNKRSDLIENEAAGAQTSSRANTLKGFGKG